MAHFELSKTPPQIRQMFSLWRASPNAAGATQSQRWRAVAAASLGNALEWFDFVIYGYFAATIAKLFFPSNSDLKSLLIALATFGITFFIRPLGAILLGAFADRHGRKSAFMLTICSDDARHGDDRRRADICGDRSARSHRHRRRSLDSRHLRRRRFRQRHGISGRARSSASRLLRELAIRQPGPDHRDRRRLRRHPDRRALHRTNRRLGLARSIRLRAVDRPGRLLSRSAR